jgi:hypothetical protein
MTNEAVSLSICPPRIEWSDVLRVPAAFPEALAVYVTRAHGGPLRIEMDVPAPRGPMHVRWCAMNPHHFKIDPQFGRSRHHRHEPEYLWFGMYLPRFFAALRGEQ